MLPNTNMVDHDGTSSKAKLSIATAAQVAISTGAQGTMSATLATKLAATNDFRFLVLERSGSTQQMAFDIVWTRNVTTVDMTRFTVVNQDDDNGGDEVMIYWSVEDASKDIWPVDPDSSTANGQANDVLAFYYDDIATGGSSTTPVVFPLVFPLPTQLANPHHMNIAFPDALWGIAWELDQGTPDDPLFHDGLNGSKDGRFRIPALDPDPQNWIVPGDLDQVKEFSKNLWGNYTLYSHGYRLDAVMALF